MEIKPEVSKLVPSSGKIESHTRWCYAACGCWQPEADMECHFCGGGFEVKVKVR